MAALMRSTETARAIACVIAALLALSAAPALAATAPGEAAESLDPMTRMAEMEAQDRWMTMTHGYAFVTFNSQGGPSGGDAFESVNHFMAMSMRRFAGGKLSLLGAWTIEPVTVEQGGSPELFQRGETYRGTLLVDRQHPHDLFVELAVRWERPISKKAAVILYLSPWGEPAVGPTAYPHRLSASENPTAPLAHHNQDSTHISADVVTAGVRLAKLTLEGSVFHGREPDENRYDIDQGAIDSYSGRLTFRPAGGLAIQISAARREHPEAIEPGDQTRQTFSVEYTRGTQGGFLAASLLVGRNLLSEGPEWGNGLEATWKFRDRNFLYGRLESVDRDVTELLDKRQRPPGIAPRRTVVQAVTLGYVRNIPLVSRFETGVGGGLTAYRYDEALDPAYGRRPVSGQAFLRLRFGAHGGVDHAHPGTAHEHGG
jgi:hypothetical protein